jgi:hypothetical protein
MLVTLLERRRAAKEAGEGCHWSSGSLNLGNPRVSTRPRERERKLMGRRKKNKGYDYN